MIKKCHSCKGNLNQDKITIRCGGSIWKFCRNCRSVAIQFKSWLKDVQNRKVHVKGIHYGTKRAVTLVYSSYGSQFGKSGIYVANKKASLRS